MKSINDIYRYKDISNQMVYTYMNMLLCYMSILVYISRYMNMLLSNYPYQGNIYRYMNICLGGCPHPRPISASIISYNLFIISCYIMYSIYTSTMYDMVPLFILSIVDYSALIILIRWAIADHGFKRGERVWTRPKFLQIFIWENMFSGIVFKIINPYIRVLKFLQNLFRLKTISGIVFSLCLSIYDNISKYILNLFSGNWFYLGIHGLQKFLQNLFSKNMFLGIRLSYIYGYIISFFNDLFCCFLNFYVYIRKPNLSLGL